MREIQTHDIKRKDSHQVQSYEANKSKAPSVKLILQLNHFIEAATSHWR
jgi:hypothetical protein